MTTAPPPGSDALASPSAARNREPILDVLRAALPGPARVTEPARVMEPAQVLELASGTGEHAVWFASALPRIRWQPSDRDEAALLSIAGWRAQSGLPNLLPALQLDAASPEAWPAMRVHAVIAINLLHISPWAATTGLMRGAAAVLNQGGLLFIYGAFREPGLPLADSNAAFDADLRSRNPLWGLRDLAVVTQEAERAGLLLERRVDMPARNLALLFRRRRTP